MLEEKYINKLHDLGLKVRPLDIFTDDRGEFVTLCQETEGNKDFHEFNVSRSKHGVLRGLHGSDTNAKLITLISGEVYWVAVDYKSVNDPKPKFIGFRWKDRDRVQIYVPTGFVIGFYVLSSSAFICYNQTEIFDPANKQLEVKWNDPRLSIDWPINSLIVSERDE